MSCQINHVTFSPQEVWQQEPRGAEEPQPRAGPESPQRPRPGEGEGTGQRTMPGQRDRPEQREGRQEEVNWRLTHDHTCTSRRKRTKYGKKWAQSKLQTKWLQAPSRLLLMSIHHSLLLSIRPSLASSSIPPRSQTGGTTVLVTWSNSLTGPGQRGSSYRWNTEALHRSGSDWMLWPPGDAWRL